MIFISLSLILLVFAHAAENEVVSSTENRLLNLKTEPDVQVCTQDVQQCSDGSFVSRDPANDCKFPECPTSEIVAFVLGDNDEAVPVTEGSDRRNMFADRFWRRSLQANEPTPADQYMLELINAARANPQGEANELLNGDLNQGLPTGTITADAKQPLSFDFALWRAAEDHSQWMLDNNVFSHTGESGSSPTQRMQSAGYVLSPPWSTGENIAYRGTTGTPDLVQFAQNNHQNLFKSPGHRRNLMSDSFKEVGVSNVGGKFNNYNAVMTTQKFATTGSKGPFITGVVFTDAVIDNDFYDAGEGLSGITITAEDKQNQANVFTTTSMGAGGFSLDVNPNTVYKVTFSGDLQDDGRSMTAVYEVSVNTENVKQDCVSDNLPVSNSPPSSEPTNPSTLEPSFEPTKVPSLEPTMEPTMQLTTLVPTGEPTSPSTSEPTSRPKWSKWGPWSECSVTCGSGEKIRTRTCIGTGCVGQSVRVKQCTKTACDVQGCDWRAVPAAECPTMYEAWTMPDCHDGMVSGELCEADSILPNNNRNYNINNCGSFDVFRYSCEGTR